LKNKKYILLLGSNLGNSENQIKEAIRGITNTSGNVIYQSSLYQTESWGPVKQNDFLNQMVVVESIYPPVLLMKKILNLELKLGRKRKEKYGPRTIDIDILFNENNVVNHPYLTLPHPEISKRKFVLLPLFAFNSKLKHPILNKSIKQLLQECEDTLIVKLWKR